MSAVLLVRQGWTVRQTARHFGVQPSTISRWVHRAPQDGRLGIPTKSSRPHVSPNRVSEEIVKAIIAERLKTKRCGQVIHYLLNQRGILVSLRTVHRVLGRQGLLRPRSPWKRWHRSTPRPLLVKPGDLVEIDTIHVVPLHGRKLYVYTLIDVCSRQAWARASWQIQAGMSLKFIRQTQQALRFSFHTIQSDHGREFSQWFTDHLPYTHRHSRVRKPNDNAHVERFNRTLQEECLRYLKPTVRDYNQGLKAWLRYYNEERPHLSLGYLAPAQRLAIMLPRS